MMQALQNGAEETLLKFVRRTEGRCHMKYMYPFLQKDGRLVMVHLSLSRKRPLPPRTNKQQATSSLRLDNLPVLNAILPR